jgi:hypothetical protein
LPTDEKRDAFASDFSVLSRIWEALSPDPVLATHEKYYRWLAQVYDPLKPSTGRGQLLCYRLGVKTIELIHENVHVDAVRDDLDTVVMDAELLKAVLNDDDPEKKAKEVSVKPGGRLRKHQGNPKYKALAERLEDLKNRHQQGLLLSIDFLKELLELAKEVVKLERETPVEEDIDRGNQRDLAKRSRCRRAWALRRWQIPAQPLLQRMVFERCAVWMVSGTGRHFWAKKHFSLVNYGQFSTETLRPSISAALTKHGLPLLPQSLLNRACAGSSNVISKAITLNAMAIMVKTALE